jgi:acyl-coenzyme A synthetase/AMP-(fatty) acid ligase
LQELKQHFDAAFLPRPIYLVAELPREKSGKLPRKNLLALWKQLSQPATSPLAQRSAE